MTGRRFDGTVTGRRFTKTPGTGRPRRRDGHAKTGPVDLQVARALVDGRPSFDSEPSPSIRAPRWSDAELGGKIPVPCISTPLSRAATSQSSTLETRAMFGSGSARTPSPTRVMARRSSSSEVFYPCRTAIYNRAIVRCGWNKCSIAWSIFMILIISIDITTGKSNH